VHSCSLQSSNRIWNLHIPESSSNRPDYDDYDYDYDAGSHDSISNNAGAHYVPSNDTGTYDASSDDAGTYTDDAGPNYSASNLYAASNTGHDDHYHDHHLCQ